MFMRSRVARASLVAMLVVCASCADRQIQIPSTPVLLNAAGDDVRAASAKALIILDAANKVVLAAQTIELRLSCLQAIDGEQVTVPGCSPVVPTSFHAEIDPLFNRYATAVIDAVDAIESGAVEGWPSLRATIDPVLTRVEALATIVQRIVDAGGGDLASWLDVARDIARELSSLFPPSGGAS